MLLFPYKNEAKATERHASSNSHVWSGDTPVPAEIGSIRSGDALVADVSSRLCRNSATYTSITDLNNIDDNRKMFCGVNQ